MDIFEQLKAPFPPESVHWRVGATNAKKLGVKPWEATKGIALAYIDARDVMERLDSVVGAGNWQCRYPLASGSLLICEIGIRVDGEWIWKANGAGETDVEADKGKCSDAFKRAAVLWGIGQYLYAPPNVWCDLDNGKIKNPPRLPGSEPKKAKTVELATADQKNILVGFKEVGCMSPRRMAWCKNVDNWAGLTSAAANTIIDECEILKREKEELKDD